MGFSHVMIKNVGTILDLIIKFQIISKVDVILNLINIKALE